MRKRLLACAVMVPIVAHTAVQRLAVWLMPLPILLLSARLAQAKLFTTQPEALSKAFPGASRIERKTAFLSPRQVAAIESASHTKTESSLINYYVGFHNGAKMGTALFETRVVRTLPMTFMTVIKPDGTLDFVEILAFHEPEDYLPRLSWLKVFRNKRLGPDLRLRRDIPNVTGASLTCQAMTDGVRQMLAVYQELPR